MFTARYGLIPYIKQITFRFQNIKYGEIEWNANSTQLDNFIDVFLALHVSGIYAHHQEH